MEKLDCSDLTHISNSFTKDFFSFLFKGVSEKQNISFSKSTSLLSLLSDFTRVVFSHQLSYRFSPFEKITGKL